MQSPASPLDRMKVSLFRSKSDRSDNSRKPRTLSAFFSPRSPNKSPASTSASRPKSDLLQFPINPRTSPEFHDDPQGHTRTSTDDSTRSFHHGDPAAYLNHRDGAVHSDEAPSDIMTHGLGDMESSFVPDQSMRPLTRPHSSSVASKSSNNHSSPPNGAQLPSQLQRDAAPGRQTHFQRSLQEDEVDYGDTSFTHSSMHHSLSSPSAAAAQRSKLRTSSAGVDPARPSSKSHLSPPQTSEGNAKPTAGGFQQAENSSRSKTAASESNDMGQGDSNSTLTRSDLRPDYIRNRLSSQRSSRSSVLSHDALSETGAGTEYDMPGEASPASHTTVRQGHELSRLPSVGSIASSMSIRTDRSVSRRLRKSTSNMNPTHERNLERLVEEDKTKTPTPQNSPMKETSGEQDPTNTAIAERVRNLEVPATVARNYRSTHTRNKSSEALDSSASLFGRAKNNLTLKEQNSKIDKLSKENFDLKLKIHFLYQALQDRSDEGVKEMISKNAQLQADLLKSRKDNQSLRKRIKELGRGGVPNEESASSRALQDSSEDGLSSRAFRQEQAEDEIAFLRDQVRHLQSQTSNAYGALKEGQKVVDPAVKSGIPAMAFDSEASHNFLEGEILRREQAEQKARQLQMELDRMRNDRSPLRHLQTKASDSVLSPRMRRSRESFRSREKIEDMSLSGTTVVDQLRQENAGLRRDLGAQTSMLTSRNRERERLQQEIEDLKLVHRRSEAPNSASGDSIFDRSVSRSNLRPTSRQSASTRVSQLSDTDRDQYEAKQARLRDDNAALRLRNQDLQADLNDLTESAEHLTSLRSEREEALRLLDEEREAAVDTIDQLEELLDEKEQEVHQLLSDLRGREDESAALQHEIKSISDSLNKVADNSENSQSIITNLRQDLSNANGELEVMEQNLRDAIAAKERLEVQSESSQNEISFLREEQEGDKIRISDLSSALTRAKSNLRDEKERLKEVEELENEARNARDEARRLRKALTVKEDELSTSREGLEELDQGLRKAIGDSSSGRQGLLKRVSNMQAEIEGKKQELRSAEERSRGQDLALQDRDTLVQNHTRENGRLLDLLEKERESRKHHQNEAQRLRGDSDGQGQLEEVERAWNEDRTQFAALEERYILHLRDRNQMLFDLWTRLSEMCGPDWLQQYCKSEDCDAPTLESASADLAGFEQILQTAVDSIENTLNSIRTRIRSTEKDIYKDFETLEQELADRCKRVDRFERHLHRSSSSASNNPVTAHPASKADLTRLKDENRLLRREIKVLKQGAFALPGLPSPQEDLERAAVAAAAIERQREDLQRPHSSKRRGMHAKQHFPHASRDSTDVPIPSAEADLLSHHSNDEARAVPPSTSHLAPHQPHISGATGPIPNGAQQHQSQSGPHVLAGQLVPGGLAEGRSLAHAATGEQHPTLSASEQRWILQMKELERRLNAEREARLLDRNGARKRLEQGKAENEELKRELEREKARARAGAKHESVGSVV